MYCLFRLLQRASLYIHGQSQIIMAQFVSFIFIQKQLCFSGHNRFYVLVVIEASVELSFVCLLQFYPIPIRQRRKIHLPATLNADLPVNELKIGVNDIKIKVIINEAIGRGLNALHFIQRKTEIKIRIMIFHSCYNSCS